MPDFSALETVIQNLFPVGHVFIFQNITYKVLICGKPTCASGEPKTDIYLKLEDCKTHLQNEVKISVKKDNAEFMENKTSPERAEALLGKDWKSIVINSTLQLQEQFNQRPLIYKSNYKKTELGAITLGWKFEILTVKSGDLSAAIKLTREQKLDIYSGSSLPPSKKDAFVNGKQITNSGVADFLLYDIDLTTLSSAEEVFEKMISIENYLDSYDPQLYFACKALNLRTFNGQLKGQFQGKFQGKVTGKVTGKFEKKIDDKLFAPPINIDAEGTFEGKIDGHISGNSKGSFQGDMSGFKLVNKITKKTPVNSFKPKHDGDRPLAVFVDWSIIDTKLTPTIIFDTPLTTKGNTIYDKLVSSLKTLNLLTTDDINETNVSSMDFVHI